MPQAFHATLDAKSKRYRYVIDNGPIASPFQLRYSWHVHQPLDVDRDGPRRRGASWAGTTSTASRPIGPTGRAASGRSSTWPSSATGDVRHDRGRGRRFPVQYGPVDHRHAVLVGTGKRPEAWVAEVLAAENRVEAGPTAPPQGLFLVAVRYDSLTERPSLARTAGGPSMRIVHVITRLILGGAQENTLLTVDGLHHHYHDDVTLITGPAEGPEGDLFDRAASARPEGRGDARAGPADPARDST